MQMAASAAGKEWRGHVEQTKKHEEAIQAALPVTTTQLALIGTEVNTAKFSFPQVGRLSSNVALRRKKDEASSVHLYAIHLLHRLLYDRARSCFSRRFDG